METSTKRTIKFTESTRHQDGQMIYTLVANIYDNQTFVGELNTFNKVIRGNMFNPNHDRNEQLRGFIDGFRRSIIDKIRVAIRDTMNIDVSSLTSISNINSNSNV